VPSFLVRPIRLIFSNFAVRWRYPPELIAQTAARHYSQLTVVEPGSRRHGGAGIDRLDDAGAAKPVAAGLAGAVADEAAAGRAGTGMLDEAGVEAGAPIAGETDAGAALDDVADVWRPGVGMVEAGAPAAGRPGV